MTDKELHRLKRAELISLLITEIQEVNDLKDAYDESEKECAQLCDDVEHLKQRLEDKDEKFKRLKAKLDEKDKDSAEQFERLKAKLDDKDKQIEHLKQRLDAKDVKIKESDLPGDREEIEKLKELLDQKNTEFENYKTNIVKTLKDKIAEREARYKSIIDKQKFVIEQLKKQIAEKK